MITRRALFSLSGLAPVAAVADTPKRPSLDEFRFKKFGHDTWFGMNCCYAGCESEDLGHVWYVHDKFTNDYRVMCDDCRREFEAKPHRLIAPPSYRY